MTKPWEKYKLGKSGYHRAEFTTVSHVTHINNAIEILKNEQFKPALVFDGMSNLTLTRVPVVWLSPNDWSYKGYLYGTVKFDFDFAELIAGKNIYWVEAKKQSKVDALRFLISDYKMTNDPSLMPYDPKTDDGPWRYLKGKYWGNLDNTLEFLRYDSKMLNIKQVTDASFVPHNKRRCNLVGSADYCPDVNLSENQSGSLMFARCLVDQLKVPDIIKTRLGRFSRGDSWADYSDDLCTRLTKNGAFTGKLSFQTTRAPYYVTAILLLNIKGYYEAARTMALEEFQSLEDFTAVVKNLNPELHE